MRRRIGERRHRHLGIVLLPLRERPRAVAGDLRAGHRRPDVTRPDPRLVTQLCKPRAQGATHHSRSQHADPHVIPPISLPIPLIVSGCVSRSYSAAPDILARTSNSTAKSFFSNPTARAAVSIWLVTAVVGSGTLTSLPIS